MEIDMKTTIYASTTVIAFLAVSTALACASQDDTTKSTTPSEPTMASSTAAQPSPADRFTRQPAARKPAAPVPAHDCMKADGSSKTGYVGASYLLPPC
jgi:hypothetical protein